MASNPPAQCCTVGVKHRYVSFEPYCPNGPSNSIEFLKWLANFVYDVTYSGEATGVEVKVGQHIGYLATPDPAKAHKDTAILYLPDVIGIWENSKLMADQFAANGYLTLIIDLFKGDPVLLNPAPGFDIFKWIEAGTKGDNPHTKEYVDPIVVDAIKWLQSEKGIKKIGAVGYCFGAKVRLL